MGKERKIIFLVDDSATSLDLGRAALSDEYNVYTFISGTLMLKALSKVTPDLVLLDVEMPELCGYEVLEILKERGLEKPVIFLTAQDSIENELKGFSAGAVDFIKKPFSAPRLLKRIEAHLLLEDQKSELLHYSNSLEKLVEEKTKSVVNIKNVLLSTMAELVEHRDIITGGHIDRTQRYMRILIDAMEEKGVYTDELAQLDTELVVISSQLHDIGKIGIRDEILLKSGRFSPEEYQEIKKHVEIGEKIITQIQKKTSDIEFFEYAKICAASHHEKWDGSGYPRGLKGEEIPLVGRIMAVVDVYDALNSTRSYKDALSHNDAVSIIEKDSGKHFDPALVEVFVEIHSKFE